MRFFLCLALVLTWPARSSFAQNPAKALIHRLSVGDTVPNIKFTLWNDTIPVKLSDFSHLVILDFWATWCGSCIRMFPVCDSLSQQFVGQLDFLLVNSVKSTMDSSRQLNNFFHRWQATHGRQFPLLTATNDTTAFKLFPHIFLPHYVWISPERRVLAITGAEAITTENIKAALKGQRLKVPVKGDRYDRDK